MRFTVVTIFPGMFESVLGESILGRAIEAGLIDVDFVDPRDFTSDRHRSVDDSPYGGGPGMVMKVEPVVAAIEAATERGQRAGAGPAHRILLSPSGASLSHGRVLDLAKKTHLVLVCGRYEGIDQRVTDIAVDEEISIGDYVITGGELGAMVVIDAVSRHVSGVLGEAASADDESFSASLLEYPQYTRPAEFRGHGVPGVLQGGNHQAIAEWRRQQSLRRTAERRPDLLATHPMDKAERKLFSDSGADWASRTYVILAHHPVYDQDKKIVTTSVTNMDLHDIARSVATYGLGGYTVVTPVTAQREKVDRILSVWRDQAFIDSREQALSSVQTASSIAEALAVIAEIEGQTPVVVATTANPDSTVPTVDFIELATERALASEPTALVFGTGWGLSEQVISESNWVLKPISGRPEFNHLSVRAAVAVILDRLFGSPRPTE